MNAIIPFSIMALIWLGLTVAAAIAGGIAHRLPQLGKKPEQPSVIATPHPADHWCALLFHGRHLIVARGLLVLGRNLTAAGQSITPVTSCGEQG